MRSLLKKIISINKQNPNSNLNKGFNKIKIKKKGCCGNKK